MSGLVLLAAIWNFQINYKSGYVGLLVSLEHLAHFQSVASLSLFYRYYLGRCSSELAQLVPLTYSWGRSTPYSDRLHDFLSSLLDVTRMFMSTVSQQFMSTVYVNRLWDSLSIEPFHLPNDVNGC